MADAMNRIKSCFRGLAATAALLASAQTAFSATPVYEMVNGDVRPDAVACRIAGTGVLAGDLLGKKDFRHSKAEIIDRSHKITPH